MARTYSLMDATPDSGSSAEELSNRFAGLVAEAMGQAGPPAAAEVIDSDLVVGPQAWKAEAPDNEETHLTPIIDEAVIDRQEKDREAEIITGLADEAIMRRVRQDALLGLFGFLLLALALGGAIWMFSLSSRMLLDAERPAHHHHMPMVTGTPPP